MQSSRVILVDEDTAARRCTERLLETHGYEVESYAHPTPRLTRSLADSPTCILLDLGVAGTSGCGVRDELATHGYQYPVVFMSRCADVSAAVQAMKHGAVDFLLKPVLDVQVLDAVERALRRDAEERAIRKLQQQARERLRILTSRELQVCGALMQGMLNKEIAFEFGLAVGTVKVHRARLMQKLGVRSLLEFVRFVDRASGSIDAPGMGDDRPHVGDGSEGRMLTSA